MRNFFLGHVGFDVICRLLKMFIKIMGIYECSLPWCFFRSCVRDFMIWKMCSFTKLTLVFLPQLSIIDTRQTRKNLATKSKTIQDTLAAKFIMAEIDPNNRQFLWRKNLRANMVQPLDKRTEAHETSWSKTHIFAAQLL